MITEFQVDGITYNLQDLPPDIVELVARFDFWQADSAKARADLDKAEIAKNWASEEIIKRVRVYNAELVKQMQAKKEVVPPAEDVQEPK